MTMPRILNFVATTDTPPGHADEFAVVKCGERIIYIGDPVAYSAPFQSGDRRQKVIDRAAIVFADRVAELLVRGVLEDDGEPMYLPTKLENVAHMHSDPYDTYDVPKENPT